MSVELTLRMRDAGAPMLLACAAAACILLTPAADASYAVITFGHMKPVMSASAAVLAAGMALGLLMFPIYALGLGVGCARDRRLGTGALLASSPVGSIPVAAGRIMANILVMAVFSLTALALVTAVVASRTKSFPDAASLAGYLLAVLPAGLCGVLAGAWMDRFLSSREGAKAGVTITLWIVLLTCSAVARPDVFGLQLIRDNAPLETGGNFAIGVISAKALSTIPWTSVRIPAAFLSGQLYLLGAVALGLGIPVLYPGFFAALLASAQRTAASLAGPVARSIELPRIEPRQPGALATTWVIGQRWFQRGAWVRLLFLGALAGAMFAPETPRVALSMALLIPLAIANARRISGESQVRQFDLAAAPMWKPSPLAFTSLALTGAAVIPLVPLLVRLPVMRSIHIVVAIAAMAAWLTWTCAGLARPLPGIFVYAMIWYFESFGDIPAAADLAAFGGASSTSFVLASAAALSLFVLLFKKDSYAFGSSRHV